MKLTMIVCAILGSLSSLALGAVWVSDYYESAEMIQALELAAQTSEAVAVQLAELNSIRNGGFSLLMLSLAVLAAVPFGRKLPAYTLAAILAVAVLIPLLFTAKTLLATILFVPAALFAFLVDRKGEVS